MAANPFAALVRLVALAGIAVAIGVSAVQLAPTSSSAVAANLASRSASSQ
jgi:hypothetical protein